MKKLLTSALMIALSIGAVKAQGDSTRHRGGKHGKAQHEMSQQRLNLSADQQAKIKIINERHRDGMKSLKAQTDLTQAERKNRMKSLHQQHKSELDAVLTAEQRAQANARHDAKGKGKQAHGNKGDRKVIHKVKSEGKDVKGGPKRGGDMAKELNLSTEQQAKIEAIRKENKARMDAVRADASLSQDQKRSRMNEIMKEQQEQMKAVLTAEQQQKMKAGRKGRPSTTKK